MLVEWLLGLVIGYFLSVISFHPNILLAFLPLLRSFDIGVFIITSLASYTVTNIAEHDRSMLKGGVVGMLVSCAMVLPLFLLDLKGIRNYSFFFLLGIISLYISMQGRKAESLLLFIAAGMSGLLFLNLNLDGNLVILSAFSGLFFSFGSEYAEKGEFELSSSLKGTISSLVMNLFPAMSPNTSLAIFNKNVESYGSAIGAAMLADCVFSLTILYLTGNPRIGALVALQGQLTLAEFAKLMLFLIFSSACMFAYFTRFGARKFCIPLWLSFAVFFSLTLIFGVNYLAIFLSCLCLGFAADRLHLSRSLLMGFLILPTLMIYV